MSQPARPAVVPPSGEQFVIAYGDQRAVVTEVGGAVRVYEDGGTAVLDGFAADAMCDGGRGQSLLPWPNRVDGGRWQWQGRTLQLGLSEADKGNAIHGLTRWVPWTLADRSASSVSLRHVLHAQSGWPFVLALQLAFELDDDGLTVRTTATNVGAQACPFAAGAHPYLSAGPGLVDDAELLVPGERYLPTDARGIPTGWVPVEGSDHDFRTARRLGSVIVDEAYADLRRDPDGRARVHLGRADGRRAVLWAGAGYPYLQTFSGDTLAPDRRRRGLAVEPMTAPPDALRSGEGLITLQPAETVELDWGLERLHAG